MNNRPKSKNFNCLPNVNNKVNNVIYWKIPKKAHFKSKKILRNANETEHFIYFNSCKQCK